MNCDGNSEPGDVCEELQDFEWPIGLSDNTKFGDIFKPLQGLDTPIEELDLSVRSYNTLKRADIHNLRHLLSASLDDLMKVRKGDHTEIVAKLNQLTHAAHGEDTT